jgi:cytochrome c
MKGKNPYIAYKGIDLTGIKSFDVTASAPGRSGATGGIIEIHVGSPSGPVIGKTSPIAVSNQSFGPPPAAANAAQKGAPLGTPVTPAAAPAGGGQGGGGGMRRPTMPAMKVDIQPTSGIQDLYFVAVNPEVKEQQIVVQIIGIEAKL